MYKQNNKRFRASFRTLKYPELLETGKFTNFKQFNEPQLESIEQQIHLERIYIHIHHKHTQIRTLPNSIFLQKIFTFGQIFVGGILYYSSHIYYYIIVYIQLLNSLENIFKTYPSDSVIYIKAFTNLGAICNKYSSACPYRYLFVQVPTRSGQ